MLQNLVSVGPPMPSTQAASGARDNQSRDVKATATNGEKFEKALKKADSKLESTKEKADRSDQKLRDPTETKTTGIRQQRGKAKKGGKEEAEEEISKFMDSLQSEIGISPARIAEALQKQEFPPEVANNEDAMETLSESLDLDGKSSGKLQQLLQGLEQRLKTLNSQDVKGLLNPDIRNAIKENQTLPVMKLIEGQALLQAQQQEKEGPASLLAPTSLNDKLTGLESLEPGLDPKSLSSLESPALSASQKLVMASAATASATALDHENVRQRITALNERFWMKNPAAESMPGPATPAMLPQGFEDKVRAMMADNAGIVSNSMNEGPQWAGASPNLPMQGMNMDQQSMGSESFTGGEDSGFKEKALKGKSTTGDSLQGLGGLDLPMPALPTNHSTAPAAAGSLGALSMLSAQERQENIQNILNGAKILLKDGGGEMKVQMSPEGMGPVELKVSMQDGRLNVEMATESREAKKLIESQMTDLKMGLAAQKLAVDSVKVDVVHKLNTDSNTQNFTNMNSNQHQQSQEQMRQLWNQFSDQFGSQNRRNSYFDVKSPSDSPAKKDALNPVGTSSKASPRRIEGKGEGLNLVA